MHIPKIIAHEMKKSRLLRTHIYSRDLVKISVAARSNNGLCDLLYTHEAPDMRCCNVIGPLLAGYRYLHIITSYSADTKRQNNAR